MNSLFCVRIVSADSHVTKPTPNLDTTYSDFKRKDVTSVPVIRIFGSTLSGKLFFSNPIHYFDLPNCLSGQRQHRNFAVFKSIAIFQHFYHTQWRLFIAFFSVSLPNVKHAVCEY